jgi:Histidine kinase-, DNA gyrase B-, and HSP90-like ATPase
VEEDVEIRNPVKPAPAGQAEQTARRLSVTLLESYALYCADEALSVVRHDVLNRVTAVGALSYELRQALPQKGEAADVARQRLEDLNRQVGLLTEVVGRRLAQPLDLRAGSLLGDALATVAGLVPAPVTASVAAGMRAPLPACELQVLLLVALSNAAESGTPIELRAARIRGEGGDAAQTTDDRIVIEVDDCGPGLSEQGLERCFDRFYTTRPGHAGLGLPVARTLVLRAGGEITLGNRTDGGRVVGARLSVVLPVSGPRRGERA